MRTILATLHDGSTIDVMLDGSGPTLLLPVNPVPVEGPRAAELRRWGVDPALGRALIDGLVDQCRVAAFDYEGHVMTAPKSDTLTPGNVAVDLLAIADAVGAERFGYYGYSWLALAGLQLAVRTDRLAGLAMGGFPPIDGPYAEMLRVTTATHAMTDNQETDWDSYGSSGNTDWSTVEVTLSEGQTRQFVTLYQHLAAFDDRAAQVRVQCPRLCFAGSADRIEYDEHWGDAIVDIGGNLLAHRTELETLGWQVRILDGLDHIQAMQAPNVLPVLRPWLASLGTR